MTCLGCGRAAPFEGRGTHFSYTCFCGALIFVSDHDIVIPSSLALGLERGKWLAHIDYYVGVSSHASAAKSDLIRHMLSQGSSWSWDCEKCRLKRCTFCDQCSRPHSHTPDDQAVVLEICMTERHQDCRLFGELRDQVVASMATTD